MAFGFTLSFMAFRSVPFFALNTSMGWSLAIKPIERSSDQSISCRSTHNPIVGIDRDDLKIRIRIMKSSPTICPSQLSMEDRRRFFDSIVGRLPHDHSNRFLTFDLVVFVNETRPWINGRERTRIDLLRSASLFDISDTAPNKPILDRTATILWDLSRSDINESRWIGHL